MYAIPQAVPAAMSPRPARKANESEKTAQITPPQLVQQGVYQHCRGMALVALKRHSVGLKCMSDLAVHIDINTCLSLRTAHTCFYYMPGALTSFCLLARTISYKWLQVWLFSGEKNKTKNWIWDLTKRKGLTFLIWDFSKSETFPFFPDSLLNLLNVYAFPIAIGLLMVGCRP